MWNGWNHTNFEHAHPTLIEEEIVDDMGIVENKVGGIQMNKIENVITNDKINDNTDEEEEELPADQ